MKHHSALIALLLAGLAAPGCDGTVSADDPSDSPDQPDAPDTPADDSLEGAGGRDLTEHWPDIDVPYSQNTKMLSFEQMQNEVQRATGRSWVVNGVDQWQANRGVFGGADYVETWSVDRRPSQQKLVTWRKMAFTVCGDAVAADAGQAERSLFAAVDPATAIDPATAATQITELFSRFFLEAPSQAEIDTAVTALTELEALENPREAWRGLCAAYLSSQRFLTY